MYQESLQKLGPSTDFPATQLHFETYELLKKVDDLSLKIIRNFSPSAASKLFDQEIREAVRDLLKPCWSFLSRKLEVYMTNDFDRFLFSCCKSMDMVKMFRANIYILFLYEPVISNSKK